MFISIKNRKLIHVLLFVVIVTIQILMFRLWLNQKDSHKNLTTTIDKIINPNHSVYLTNLATKSFFEAGNYFNLYLQNQNPKSFSNYKTSLQTMVVYLDSLKILTEQNNIFSEDLKTKEKKENEVLKFHKELDSLMRLNISPLDRNKSISLNIQKYNYETVLNSITFDTTKTITEAKKKGILGRIGNALKGKSESNKEETKTVITMVFRDQAKTGTFADQLKNIFQFTDVYYGKKIKTLKSTYFTSEQKRLDLLSINQIILEKSQNLLLLYSNSNQELAKIKYINDINAYDLSLKNKNTSIFYLLLAMAFATFILLIYTIYAYKNEKYLFKAKKEAENNLEFKNRLIGMLSHEMRAPLNIISNLTEKLKKANTDTKIESKINLLNFTSNSLQITVNQILEFFKHQNSKLVLYNSKVNIKKEITSILESLKTITEIKKIDLIIDLDSSLKNEVMADVGKIHQLFYNIIGNAIKFTDNGSITVQCNITPIDDKLRFDVKIKDTGIGIPKEDLDKVFNNYFQSKHHQDQIALGAGLGLNLCQEIVRLYSGEIAVKSELKKGTEISFYLLLDKINDAVDTNQSKCIEKFQNKNIKIALVDDDSISLSLIKKMLKDVGITAQAFESSDTIKTYLETEIVDIIVSDLHLGNKSGIELINEIRAFKNKNMEARVIMVTGDVYIKETINLKNTGIDQIITKPVSKEKFYHELLKVLENE